MKKIVILGNSGGGKSTLADRLSKLLHIPVMHLDIATHDKNWNSLPYEEVVLMIQEFMKNESWIIEGQYTGYLYEERVHEADCIIFFDMHRFRAFWRSMRRHHRIERGKEKRIGAGEYKFKAIDPWFIWYLLWGYPQQKRSPNLKILKPFADKLVIIKNDKDIEKFVSKLS